MTSVYLLSDGFNGILSGRGMDIREKVGFLTMGFAGNSETMPLDCNLAVVTSGDMLRPLY
jgi:hypothetical protein